MILPSSFSLKSSVPHAILFIAGAHFFKNYFDNGTTAILPLYLEDVLDFSQQNARLYFHVYCMILSFCLLFAGLLGDSSLGKYRTIIYLITLATTGGAIFTVASISVFDTENKRLLTSLSVLATSLGGACGILVPFGADQFVSPQHSHNRSYYFSLMFFLNNVAGLLATYISPILRHNFQCFGSDTCFPLAFLVLDAMLIASFVVFVLGRSYYIRTKPDRNVILDVIKCACYALSKKVCSLEERKQHWLDYAGDKYSKTLISDTKAAFRALWLMLPVPIFLALDDQTGSTWVFQAVHMDGSLGWFTIKPDQMQLVDALMTLMLVPLFDLIIYPQLAKRHLLTQPLQRLTVSTVLITVSFVLAAILELKIQTTQPQPPGPGTSQLRVFNGINCDVKVSAPLLPPSDVIPSLDALQLLDLPLRDSASLPVHFTTAGDCYLGANLSFAGSAALQERQASSLFLHVRNHTPVVSQVPGFDRIDKRVLENPKLRILYNLAPFESEVTLTTIDYSKTFALKKGAFSTSLDSILQTGEFSARLGNTSVFADIQLGPAGIYTLILYSYNDTTVGRLITVTPPNTVHMLWQLPQYVVITVAEVMFFVTSLELSYTQAPESMKSFIAVMFKMMDAFGNLIVILVILSQYFHNQVYEYLFYAGLMVVGTCYIKYISTRHQYYDPDHV